MFVGSLHKAKYQFKNNTKPKGLRKVPNHEHLAINTRWLKKAYVKTLTAIKNLDQAEL